MNYVHCLRGRKTQNNSELVISDLSSEKSEFSLSKTKMTDHPWYKNINFGRKCGFSFIVLSLVCIIMSVTINGIFKNREPECAFTRPMVRISENLTFISLSGL